MTSSKRIYYSQEDWGPCIKCGEHKDRRYGLCFECAGNTTGKEWVKLYTEAKKKEWSSQHNEFCEGHLVCPTTGEDACSKVVVWGPDGLPCTVLCFSCNRTHNIKMEAEN